MVVFFNYKSRSKYSNKKVTFNGIKFDSSGEMRRYAELKVLEKAGELRNLVTQPRFLLQDKFQYKGQVQRAIEYVADFKYDLKVDGEWVPYVEDFKGYKTDIYRLKKKLFIFKYGDSYEFIESSSK